MSSKTQRFLLFLLALGFSPVRAWSDDNDERRYTEITGSGRSVMTVPVPLAVDGRAGAATCLTLQQVISRNLTLIGWFKVLDPKAYLANLAQDGAEIDPQRQQSVASAQRLLEPHQEVGDQ